jgi:putative transposase
VFLKAYASVAEARQNIGAWLSFYNDERKHQALGYHTPTETFETAQPVDMWTTQERALPTYPQAQQQQEEKDSFYEKEGVASGIGILAA